MLCIVTHPLFFSVSQTNKPDMPSSTPLHCHIIWPPSGTSCYTSLQTALRSHYIWIFTEISIQYPVSSCLTYVQHYNTTALQHYSTTTLQHYSTAALQHYNTAALQHYSTTTPQHYSTTTLQHYSTTALQHYSTAALQHYSTTALQHHSTTTLQHYSTTALQHYSTADTVASPTLKHTTTKLCSNRH